jgi:hypothetical protein
MNTSSANSKVNIAQNEVQEHKNLLVLPLSKPQSHSRITFPPKSQNSNSSIQSRIPQRS